MSTVPQQAPVINTGAFIRPFSPNRSESINFGPPKRGYCRSRPVESYGLWSVSRHPERSGYVVSQSITGWRVRLFFGLECARRIAIRLDDEVPECCNVRALEAHGALIGRICEEEQA